MLEELIGFWQTCNFTVPPFAHPEDLELIRTKGRGLIEDDPTGFEAFIASARFGNQADDNLHPSLLPVPYAGDLRNASTVILMLNPGFEYSDYWAEYKSPEFRERLIRSLAQDFAGTEFPFVYLDPAFCWHSGFMWWEKKLRDVIRAIAHAIYGDRYLPALRDLSRTLACIELVPYHSTSFNDHKLLDHLPSVQRARAAVRHSLIPEADADKRTVIVTRQVKGWGVPTAGHNLVIYEGGHTRGASLSTNSAGGKAILRRYGIDEGSE